MSNLSGVPAAGPLARARRPVEHGLVANTLSMLVLMAVIPISGALSDTVGRRPVLLWSSVAIVIPISNFYST